MRALLMLVASIAGAQELILCGADEVYIVNAADTSKKLWTWRSPAKEYRYVAECKIVDGGRRVLLAASSDGVALVERATGRTEWHAIVANAHSADMLPGGRIAVAASHRGVAGDRLFIFDASTPMKHTQALELPAGHGVVWDSERKTLWALSGKDLRAYDSGVRLQRTWPLPDAGGHDLNVVPGTPLLSVTTNELCWVFDRDRHTFAPHPVLGSVARVKSISTHPRTGRIAYVTADPGGWWSEWIRFHNPQAQVRLAGEKLYKARWID
jgi:hypothetical protein